MIKKMNKYYNYVFIIFFIYWLIALIGKNRGKEIFPFFWWDLYSYIPVDTITYNLKIIEIDGVEENISFYDFNHEKLDFRVLEKIIKSYSLSNKKKELYRLKKFLPDCSVSELKTKGSKTKERDIYIINE